MKFTFNWLREYVEVGDLSAVALADRLTMLGLEVDAVEDMAAGLAGFKTARIEAVRPHPDADRLTLCDVVVDGEPIQVVCGAPNARVGLVTVIAPPGQAMPAGMKIRKAKVRGQESLGMLCSEVELGLSSDHSGIMELPADVPPGRELVDVLGLRDSSIEIDLTPNRADCASVIGIAREVGGITGFGLTLPVDPAELPPIARQSRGFSVEVLDPDLCPRYAARVISGVRIGPSPLWLRQRLRAVGMRSINNVVDVTNLVMLEYGQPLHAFDAARLEGRKIVVRRPSGDETSFTTLDEVERPINGDMLMICDAVRPVAVAGIMGGLHSEVTAATTEVLLESACFNPVSIRGTARRLNLASEASYRFERGVDRENVTAALERAARLICELAGGEAAPEALDLHPGREERLCLKLRVWRVCTLIGMALDAEQIASLLRGIDFEVDVLDEGLLDVKVPSFRVDVEREIDLVEEVARLKGYDNIPTRMPRIDMDNPVRDPMRILGRTCSRVMTVMGFFEAINYSFVAESHADMLGLGQDAPGRARVALLNPLSREQAVMRSSLLPGLLENLRTNLNFQQPDLRIYEIGKVFLDQGAENGLPEERHQLAALLCGGRRPGASALHFGAERNDSLDAKAAIEALVLEIDLQGVTFSLEGENPGYADPCALGFLRVGSAEAGRYGRIAPAVARAFDLKPEVYFLELDLEVINAGELGVKAYRALPRYPSIKRDVALVVDESVPAGDLVAAVNDGREKLVESTEIFDVYRGKNMEKGKKSVAVSVVYRSAEQTLDDEGVDRVHNRIVQDLMSRFGGRYREEGR